MQRPPLAQPAGNSKPLYSRSSIALSTGVSGLASGPGTGLLSALMKSGGVPGNL